MPLRGLRRTQKPRDPGHRRPRERDTRIANTRGLPQEHRHHHEPPPRESATERAAERPYRLMRAPSRRERASRDSRVLLNNPHATYALAHANYQYLLYDLYLGGGVVAAGGFVCVCLVESRRSYFACSFTGGLTMPRPFMALASAPAPAANERQNQQHATREARTARGGQRTARSSSPERGAAVCGCSGTRSSRAVLTTICMRRRRRAKRFVVFARG